MLLLDYLSIPFLFVQCPGSVLRRRKPILFLSFVVSFVSEHFYQFFAEHLADDFHLALELELLLLFTLFLHLRHRYFDQSGIRSERRLLEHALGEALFFGAVTYGQAEPHFHGFE